MADQLSVRIDDELEELLDEEVEAHPYDPSKSDVVRTALREYLEGNAERSPPVATAD